MADAIDQLNFEVILKDEKFEKTIKKDLGLAKELNVQLSDILTNKKRLDSATASELVNAEKVAAATAKRAEAEQRVQTEMARTAVQQQKVRTETERTKNAQEGVTSKVYQTREALTSTEKVMRTLSQLTGVAFSVVGIRRFLSSLVDITGQFEVQRMALRSMLQDIDGADKIFEDLYRFSSESTYRFSELAKYAKQLAAFNIDQNNLLETTKMLGDVASGVGVSMDRIILAYGHVKSSGFLRGIQLRSFSQNGVPILEELAKMFTEVEKRAVSLGEVFDKMTKREIPFEMVEEAFRRMTSEGGKFYQMQEVLAKTLAGQINILKGRWENMLAAVGQSQDGILKGTVGKISDLIADYEKFGVVVKEVIAVIGAYRAGVILTTLATEGLSAATNIGLLGAMKNLMKWIAANPWAILAATITLVTVEIVKATKALTDFEKITKAIDDATANYEKDLGSEMAELDALTAAMKNAREGTDEFKAAKLALEKRFGPYVQKLRDEGVEVNNLSVLYDGLAKKIQEANKQRYLEISQKDLSDAYSDAQDNIQIDFEKLISEKKGLTADQIGALRHFMYTGEKNATYKTIQGLDRGARRTMVGAGGGTITWEDEKTFESRLMELWRRWDLAGLKFSEGMQEAAKKFDVDFGGSGADSANESIYKISSIIDGIKKLDSEIEKIRSKARKGSITESEKTELEELIKDRGEQAKLYEDIMGVKYDKDMRGVARGESAAEKAIKGEISATKAHISILEKYKNAYDKLSPIFGEDTNGNLATLFGGNAKDYENLDEQIASLVSNLRKLGEEGNEAADAIEARLGTDAVSKLLKSQTELEKHQKALDKYEKTLRKWIGEDFNLGGTGFEYDINKVFSDFNTKVASVQEKYIEAVKEAEEAHKGDADAIARETANLQALRDAEIEYERVRSQESLNNLAESYLKDQYFYRGINLDHISRMSFRQISQMKKELKEISDEALHLGGDISYVESFLASLGMSIETLTDDDLESLRDKLPETTIEFIKAAKAAKDTGLSFDNLSGLIQSALKKKLEELTEEELKALAKLAKYAAKEVLALAKSFSELADATGNDRLKQTAESISALGQFASDVAQGFSQGGVYGAIIGAVASIGKTIMNDIKEEEIAAKEAKEAAIALSNLEDKRAVERQSGIFGTNDIGKLREYVKILQRYGKAVSEIESGMKFRAEGGNSLATEFMKDYGDGNGNLDIFKLKEAVESGLLSFTDEEVNNAIKQYADALKEVDGLVESVFGDIAASAADTIVDSWVEAGNAALDYADILDDVARAYSKMLIQSVIMETALDPITDDLKAAFMQGRYGDAMEMVAGAMQAIQDATPMYEQILNTFDPYFNRSGSGSGASGLSSGIKSITEDTANLLASYINAIRADVSNIRMMQEKGWGAITTLGASIPTLNDHIAQIAATNFDIAQSNQSILSELRSVIGTPGTSGMVVRVERI